MSYGVELSTIVDNLKKEKEAKRKKGLLRLLFYFYFFSVNLFQDLTNMEFETENW